MPKFKDETGKRYGRLTVLRKYPVPDNPQAHWLCRCDCGQEFVTRGDNLRSGRTKSCGCLRSDCGREALTRYKARKKGET